MDHHVQRSQSVNMSHTLVDQLLTKQALAGDQDSLEVLIKKYEQPLRSYMRRMLKDQELIADVLQAVFFQLHVSLPKGPSSSRKLRSEPDSQVFISVSMPLHVSLAASTIFLFPKHALHSLFACASAVL